MAIPFREQAAADFAGPAAFLRFVAEPSGRGLRGALFLMSASGEPREFCFTRVDVAPSLLWRPGEQRRSAVVALCRELFRACAGQPVLLLVLADEVSPRVFTEDLAVDIPVGRIETSGDGVEAADELAELFEEGEISWSGQPPEPASAARHVLTALVERGLLFEPFERVADGLKESFDRS